jgi:hypothetical protein
MKQKCNYCGRTEVCGGAYPEGCFLKDQIASQKALAETMESLEQMPSSLPPINIHIGFRHEVGSNITAVEWLATALYENFEMKGDGKQFDELLQEALRKEKLGNINAALKPLYLMRELREKHGYFGGHDNGAVIDREIGILEDEMNLIK